LISWPLESSAELPETRLRWLREDTKKAKEEYERAVTTRATTQSDVNSLLERKHAWSDEDVSRFTQLVRSDHSSNQAVTTTAVALKETELATDKAFSDLMQAILQRYHEEQVWSDKIRNVSTYAGLAGLLVNLVVFVGAIAFVEPWKRKRLVERLEDRIGEMMVRVEGSISGLGEKVERDMTQIRAQTGVGGLSGAVIAPPAEAETIPTPETSPLVIMPSLSPISQILKRISPLLDKVAPPSRDRDIAFSAGCGAVLGMTATAISLWLGR
jgi:sensitive to high expression protein 9